MRTVSVGLSDVGRKRAINEDAFFRDDRMGFYVVADGVGGHTKGEVASHEAVEQLRMWVYGAGPTLERCIELCATRPGARSEVRRLLESGVQSACYMVFGMAELDPSKRGMSTTVSALLIRNGLAFAAHVGDSRVYRLRGRDIIQLTEDHTLINYKLKHGLITPDEASKSDSKHVITRAVGHKDYVQVDTADVDVEPGDRFLLCTDGLHAYLRGDDELVALIAGDDLDASVTASIALANERGGRDNITALLIDAVA
jgi:protein phosphatase